MITDTMFSVTWSVKQSLPIFDPKFIHVLYDKLVYMDHTDLDNVTITILDVIHLTVLFKR
jgi:hypothetical protein